ncbi:MepB family protein [Chryseobacterium gotjawalense]|uniref:MepB family protein n=1 Tax=Chryseobacterium gotjawalense TaxID=3042315 RepID=A0ABY8RC00_9FLAO|nr:MepB family protein [Chryseobacterium sp. wdc7]WHF51491.1 MepB family protein [Chryseobacterium sp. wdc7]
MKTENLLYSNLKVVKQLIDDQCGFELTNLKLHSESVEYSACSFELNGKKVEYRVSKITPKKTGQFVTVWKRNKNGVTEPFDILDDIDFIIITSKSDHNIGQFIFPKSVLADKGIISQNGKGGKRGIRVYPSWDITTSRQAEKTQSWQTKYFFTIKNGNSAGPDLLRKLFDTDNPII